MLAATYKIIGTDCPCCGKTHRDIPVFQFVIPREANNYWGVCPEFGEPFTVTINDIDEELEPNRHPIVFEGNLKFPMIGPKNSADVNDDDIDDEDED